MESYTRNYPRDKSSREEEIINIVRNLKKFTIEDIKGKISLSEGTIRNYLTYLNKIRIIEKTGTIPHMNGPSFYNEYRILKM